MSGDDSGVHFGILACGAYLPCRRLPQSVIADAHGWFDPALSRPSDTQRSFANWDEDALTMAVEAGRSCLTNMDADAIEQLDLASTTVPFADRSNVGIVREALALPDEAGLADSGGSLRAGSQAMQRAFTNDNRMQLVIGTDCVDSKPASPDEASSGHGAAALLIGRGEPLASLLGQASKHYDFVDHYRASDARFNYKLEARWARDAGYREQTATVFAQALSNAGIKSDSVDHLLVAAAPPLAKAVARVLKQDDAASGFTNRAGFCGAAQPLLLLAQALEQAQPGQTIALVTLGQGIDVMLFKVHRAPKRQQLGQQIYSGQTETNYSRYLALRGLVELETGLRAERDNRTAQSAAWRNHEAITGFTGGQCADCGTLQFPPSKVCVKCGAQDTQQPRRMADLPGTVRSFTEDWLAYTPSPPLIFGNVGFPDGANVMMEFTDAKPGQLEVGLPVQLRFRIKDIDQRRGFRRYFWKPSPLSESEHG